MPPESWRVERRTSRLLDGSGLIAATILTLTFLPALYALAFKVAASVHEDARSIAENHHVHSEAHAAA